MTTTMTRPAPATTVTGPKPKNLLKDSRKHRHLIEEWDAKENERLGLDLNTITCMSGKKVAWKCRKHQHEWTAAAYSRSNGHGCPICAGKQVLAGFNDLATTHPALAQQFVGPGEGEELFGAEDITAGSNKKAVWQCEDYPHTWTAKVASRSNGQGCGVCAGKQVLAGFNDLATTHPALAQQFVGPGEGEGYFSVQDVTAGTNKKAVWQCKDYPHTWATTVANRSRGQGCGVCAGQQVLAGFNDLATTHPALAQQFVKPGEGEELFGVEDITAGTKRKAVWQCSTYDTHTWTAAVANRSRGGHGCPICAGRQVLVGFNDLATTHPALAQQFVGPGEGEEPFGVEDVTAGTKRKAVWQCSTYDTHTWTASILSRSRGGHGCPICAGGQVLAGFNDLATTHPALAQQFVKPGEGEGHFSVQDVTAGTERKAVWQCEDHPHTWTASIKNRSNGRGCPACAHGRPSLAEVEVRDFVTAFGLPVVANKKTTLDIKKELDGYIPAIKFAFEFNGNHWHSDAQKDAETRHIEKYESALRAGITLIFMWEDEWLLGRETRAKARMQAFLKNLHESRTNPAARHKVAVTQLKPVSKRTANAFLNEHHLEGQQGVYAEAYGVVVGELLVAVVTLTLHGSQVLISQYAATLPIQNLLTAVLAHVQTQTDVKLTTARVTTMNGRTMEPELEEEGFQRRARIKPDWLYVNNKQRHKICTRLPQNHPRAATGELTKKIWDAGQTVWEKKL